MLRSAVFTLGHGQFVASSEVRHASNCCSGLFGLCGVPYSSIVPKTSTGSSSLRGSSVSGASHVKRGREPSYPSKDEDRLEASGLLGVKSGKMAEDPHEISRMVESAETCDERLAVLESCKCNLAISPVGGWSDAQDGHQELSDKEVMERWEFLKCLPHKLLRDIGYVIVGPSLLLNSAELPTVSTSMLGGSSNQWSSTKAWLQQLTISAVEAWFASHRPSQRLGDHFALCIEYVLRHCPFLNVQQLLTSQQVLQRVTDPVRSKGSRSIESKSVVLKNSCRYKTVASLSAEAVFHDELKASLGPHALSPKQEEQHAEQQLLPYSGATTLKESTLPLESLSLAETASGTVGGILEVKIGKRKRKLLRKLERIRLRKGKTTTIGEFDFLFETPVHNQRTLSDNVMEGKEVHHWEVSVKYLLYAGPWEIFGLESPKWAAWSNREREDRGLEFKLSCRNDFNRRSSCCSEDVSVSEAHGLGVYDDSGSLGTKTATISGRLGGLHGNGSEEEDNEHLLMNHQSQDRDSDQDNSPEKDKFLGCFLGPHVGETLLDRKARLRNQLTLSTNSCAALMLRGLFISNGTSESKKNMVERPHVDLQTIVGCEITENKGGDTLKNVPSIEAQVLEASVIGGLASTAFKDGGQDTVEEKCDDESSEWAKELSVVPGALLKGYLFYEYKLWRFLESQRLQEVTTNNPTLSSAILDTCKQAFEDAAFGVPSRPDELDSISVQDSKLNDVVVSESSHEAKGGVGSDEDVNRKDVQRTQNASLNINHWMGWWTRNIMEFADSPLHQQSKWYVVPKLEWLSPVVIPESDKERCARVLSLSDFVVTAAEVADEAARLHMPRKRRFLVAELRWTRKWEHCHENIGVSTCVRSTLSIVENQVPMRAWMEVSRGFVVEDTWPVSRMYRPHGYVVSWSPSLQGQRLDV